MEPNPHPFPSVIAAVPVYGTRVLPRFGVARDFLIAEAVPDGGVVTRTEHRTWEPSEVPNLARWLAGLGVAGVICGGIHPRFVVDLETEGLWVLWGQQGDAEEVIDKWARGEVVVCGVPACLDKPHRKCAQTGTLPPETQGKTQGEVP